MDCTIFDAHCDTLSKLTDFGGELKKNSFQFDLERAGKYSGGYVQVFAAFVDRKSITASPLQRVMSLADTYFREVEQNCGQIAHCETRGDIENALKAGKCAALLGVEGGEALEGHLENLRMLWRLGVRIMTLTWNHSNELCDGIGETRGAGLTDFGRKTVLEMNRLGMLIDVSHISVKGFWDVIETSGSPIAATHSNAYALRQHPRNLNDAQIKAIVENGGCIGVSIYPEFVTDGACRTADIVRHIEHIMALGGEDNVGLGSDFDGIDRTPDDIRGAEDIYRLAEELLRLGYAETAVRKITSGNFLRLLDEVLLS